MSLNITRRDILKLAGGSVLGFLFSPVPWKVLDDTSIWTQNWSLIPPLPRGPISFKYSSCTLCPGACALKARCVSGHPVSLTGVVDHPVSRGILCPVGLTGHHFSYHPLRLSEPQKFTGRNENSRLTPVSLEEAISEMSKIVRELQSVNNSEAVAVLDGRPGRSLSRLYQEFLSTFPRGYYLLPPSREDSTLAAIQGMMQPMPEELSFDLEHSRVILSFGAALIDGWNTPGRMIDLFNRRRENGVKIIQVEGRQSRTALHADTWVPVKPGTEAVFALGLAHVILAEALFSISAERKVLDFDAFKEVAAQFKPERVAEITGISAEKIFATARSLAGGPSVVIAGCDPGGGPLGREIELAAAALNILLGNVGRRGGIIGRPAMPDKMQTVQLRPHMIADVPDRSIHLLIVDGAESGYRFPWSLLERKLVPGKGVVVSLSPYLSALSARADYLIPAPAHLESLEEVVLPAGSTMAGLSLSVPLMPMPEKTVEPVNLIRKLLEAVGTKSSDTSTTEQMIKTRLQAVYASKRGSVYSPADGAVKKITDMESPDELWTALTNGGCWIDSLPSPEISARFCLLGSTPDIRERLAAQAGLKGASSDALLLTPFGWKNVTTSSEASPIMSKLFQESGLRSMEGVAFVNPATALSNGLSDDEPASIRTGQGEMEMVIHSDTSVMPGVIFGAVGPSPNMTEKPDDTNYEGVLALCNVRDDGTWRITEAKIYKA